ncbi:MAG TPA: hypothetical protein VF504_06090, partial [Solirubrobacterales bacterium]
MNGAVERFQQLPKRRCGAVTENGPLATGENSGHEAPVETQAAVADGVDALVDAVEAPELQAMLDRTRTHSEAQQLPA